MDSCPYDNVEFPIQRPSGTGTWPGPGQHNITPKFYNQTVVRDKKTSSLAPVFEGEDGSFEELAEMPEVEDQRQKAQVTSPQTTTVDKKETVVSANKGVHLANSTQTNALQQTTKPTQKSSTLPASMGLLKKDSKPVVIEQPRSIATHFKRHDFNPRSQHLLEKVYTRHTNFNQLNKEVLEQANIMKETVWDVKGKPSEILTYEQLLQGILVEGEMFVLSGTWLYFTNIDFLSEDGETSIKPSIGRGRICLTNQRLLILSAESVTDANLAEYEKPSASEHGYKLEVSKYNSIYFQNIPVKNIYSGELVANLGHAEESRISKQSPFCCGACSCLGIKCCSKTWIASDAAPVLINKRVVYMGVHLPPWKTKATIVVHLNPEMPLAVARDFVAQLHNHAPMLS